MSDPLIGQVMLFGGNYAPRGWAFCEGQILAISEYTTLYSILGTYYGGNGVNTFALPDLRGRAAIGAGSGPGLTPHQIGERGGSEYTLLTQQHLPSHNHYADASGTVTSTVTGIAQGTATLLTATTATQATPDGAYPAPLTASFGGQNVEIKGYGTPSSGNQMASGNVDINVQVSGTATGSLNNATVSVADTGGGLPVHHLQPYTATRYIIALEGVYPSRN